MVSMCDNLITLIGIDPGSSKLGVGIMVIDSSNSSIVESDAFTLNADSLITSDWIREIHGDRIARITALQNELNHLFNQYNPIAVACESPYFSMRQPGAFSALTEVMYSVRQAVMSYNICCPFYTVEPSNVKKAVNAGWISNKDSVKSALGSITEIMNCLITDFNQLDEHSIDARIVTGKQIGRAHV